MNARDFRGEAHAPAPYDPVRAPRTQADDYTPVAASACCTAWDYEQQVDVADAAWTAVAGRRQGGEQRALVRRSVPGIAPVLDPWEPDATQPAVWGSPATEAALLDAYTEGRRDEAEAQRTTARGWPA